MAALIIGLFPPMIVVLPPVGIRPIADDARNVQHSRMNDADKTPQERLINFYLEDATDRLRFQHDYSIAGFKTLILINGGAVIALLTYVGNVKDGLDATNLQWAFFGYIAGLAVAMAAYLTAYLGQALIMHHSSSVALSVMGAQEADRDVQERRESKARMWIAISIGLCVSSLVAFVAGSIAAMCGLA